MIHLAGWLDRQGGRQTTGKSDKIEPKKRRERQRGCAVSVAGKEEKKMKKQKKERNRANHNNKNDN